MILVDENNSIVYNIFNIKASVSIFRRIMLW